MTFLEDIQGLQFTVLWMVLRVQKPKVLDASIAYWVSQIRPGSNILWTSGEKCTLVQTVIFGYIHPSFTHSQTGTENGEWSRRNQKGQLKLGYWEMGRESLASLFGN